jgi:hypothetical protein
MKSSAVMRVPDGTAGRVRQQLQEWLWRGSALREVTAQLPAPSERAFEQARLLREVVKQVAEPVDPVRGGRRPAVVLGLVREWVYWMLADEGAGDASDLASLWRKAAGERLRQAAGNDTNLEAVRRALLDLSAQASLDVSDEDVARTRTFAEALYQQIEAPRRRVDRVLRQRWIRSGAVAVLVLAALFGLRSVIRGRDLVAGKPFQTSSSYPGCGEDPNCAAQLFHTKEEDSPWVEFDLEKPRRVHIVEIENRMDCCQDRAVPLIVELSTDHTTWTEVARQEKADFKEWEAKFPRTMARYVRLRVPRRTVLHLHGVKVR